MDLSSFPDIHRMSAEGRTVERHQKLLQSLVLISQTDGERQKLPRVCLTNEQNEISISVFITSCTTEPWYQNSRKSNQHNQHTMNNNCCPKSFKDLIVLRLFYTMFFLWDKTPVFLKSTCPRRWKLHSCLKDMSCWVLRSFQPTGETDPMGTKIIDFRKRQKRMASTNMVKLHAKKHCLAWNDICNMILAQTIFDQVANTGRKRSCHWRFISAASSRVAWGKTWSGWEVLLCHFQNHGCDVDTVEQYNPCPWGYKKVCWGVPIFNQWRWHLFYIQTEYAMRSYLSWRSHRVLLTNECEALRKHRWTWSSCHL